LIIFCTTHDICMEFRIFFRTYIKWIFLFQLNSFCIHNSKIELLNISLKPKTLWFGWIYCSCYCILCVLLKSNNNLWWGYESQICHMHTILFLSHLIATLPTPHGLVGIKLSILFYLLSTFSHNLCRNIRLILTYVWTKYNMLNTHLFQMY
jgi:hypothetical protein